MRWNGWVDGLLGLDGWGWGRMVGDGVWNGEVIGRMGWVVVVVLGGWVCGEGGGRIGLRAGLDYCFGHRVGGKWLGEEVDYVENPQKRHSFL